MNEILEIFNNAVVDTDYLNTLVQLPEPNSRYIIAITPRSGSTYLSNMLSMTGKFGRPLEPLGKKAIARKIKKMPGRNPDEYARNIILAAKSDNDVSGLKASWFQFRDFMEAMEDSRYFSDFKFIYLTRQNLAAQAVSLYKATASSVFHTSGKHSEQALEKLAELEYSFAEIDYWYQHIVNQETGWQDYFLINKIEPLSITYEDIEQDILAVMKRIAHHIALNPDEVLMPKTDSIFKKISDSRNTDWAERYAVEKQAIDNPLPVNKFKNMFLRLLKS